MWRWLWLPVLLALLSGVPALAQSTSVSATIIDSGSQAWAFGSVQFRFRPADSNPTGQYFWNGAPFDKSTTIPQNPLALDGSGAFSGVSVPSNNFITPAGSTWTVTVCPGASTPCTSQNLTITGTTQTLSITPPAIILNLTVPLLAARAYSDSEVTGAIPGTDYFNITDNRTHLCIQTGFPPCTWVVINGGAGTVTSVSGLTPLFSVTNPTTTPTFVLLNAPSTTVFGNPTGSPAPPGYFPLSSFGGIVNSVTGTANQITASPTTGSVTLSIPVIAIFPGSFETNDSITTDNGDFVTGLAGRVIAGGNITTSSGQMSVPTNRSYGFTGGSQMFMDVGGALHFKLASTADAPLVASGATLSGLTPSRCVETTTGGLLTVASGNCSTGGGVISPPFTCNLASPISGIGSGSTQTVITCAATAPASGCPCRAHVSWNIAAQGTSSTEQVEAAISDGTNTFAGTSAILTNQVTTGFPGINRSDISPVTYTNSQAVTFTLSAVSDHTWTIETATSFLNLPTQVRITYIASN